MKKIKNLILLTFLLFSHAVLAQNTRTLQENYNVLISHLEESINKSIDDFTEQTILENFKNIGIDDLKQCSNKCYVGSSVHESFLTFECDENKVLKEIIVTTKDKTLIKNLSQLQKSNTKNIVFDTKIVDEELVLTFFKK